MERTGENPSSTNESFLTTRWTLVLNAAERGSPQSGEALARLCGTYWYPLFAFARRCGHNAVDAQDLTQGFFEALLEKDFLKDAQRERGRFRSFLLACFKHYIAKQHRAARAQKRGGRQVVQSIDFTQADDRYANEPYHEVTAEQLFDHHWARTLIEQVLARLRDEYGQTNKGELFARLKIFLGGETELSYQDVAATMNMSEGAIKVAVHRLRQRFSQALRQEIELTVTNPDEVDDEIRGLFQALRLQA
jgi:RNA polymerase sigma-70 factor (ECF subfamily)